MTNTSKDDDDDDDTYLLKLHKIVNLPSIVFEKQFQSKRMGGRSPKNITSELKDKNE